MMLNETNEVRETRSALVPQETLIARGLPTYCYAMHPSTKEITMIRRGQMGYHVFPDDGTGLTVDDLNRAIGVTAAQREAMSAGSIFGFHVPGADPLFYKDAK
jgi:hypothetical protein